MSQDQFDGSDQAEKLRALAETGQFTARERVGVSNRPALLPSVPIGRVSFGPVASRPSHHVVTPSQLVSHSELRREPAAIVAPRLSRAMAITSGKGGVGKTNIAVNLAVCLAQLGLRVCLLDGDLGLANADVLCNLTPRVTLDHVISGKVRLSEAAMFGPGGFRLIPGASGVSRLAELSGPQRARLLEELTQLERVADLLIIDTCAGIGSTVLSFAAAANTMLVVTTPEPTSITDGYGMIKALLARSPQARIELLVNMAANAREGQQVFARVDRVSRTFLNRPLVYAGCIEHDARVCAAVRQRLPVVLLDDQSAAAQSMRLLARRVAGVEHAAGWSGWDGHSSAPAEGGGFFNRLAALLGIRSRG